MSENNNDEAPSINVLESKKYKNITIIRKISLNIIIVLLWGVSATFNLIDLYRGVKLFQSIWTYLTLGITLLLIFMVLIPFRMHIKSEFERSKEEKEKSKEEKNKSKE
ncbi:MAG: hypothetical protein ACTSQE_05455 [Candidatus Heimdallarchaeaceae archaeon]